MDVPIKNEYSILLNSDEWKQKREEIHKRNGFKCTKCNSPGTTWIPSSDSTGGSNVLIIENEPITDFPKSIECVDRNIQLHIHHKNYIIENGVLVAPWDCKNDELVTLCGKCHEIVHEKEIVQIFERINDILYTTNKFNLCPKCFGEGYILEFSHVQNGVCFMCSGKGVFTRSNLTNKLQ